MRARIGPRIDRLLDWREYPILFVDDEPENLRVFELTFRREFHVRTASSGEEALERLHESPASLVLSDHRMEGMSGVELLAKVREIDPKTIRILVTAFGDAATLSDAINNGWIYRYMPKPWRPEEMRLALRNGIEVYALDREREELLYELEVLNRCSKLLNRELELVPLLDLLLDTLTGEFGYDGATVFLFDAARERLQAVRSAPRDTLVAQRLSDLDMSASAAPHCIGRLLEGEIQFVRMAELLDLESPVRRLATEIAADEIMLLPLVGHDGVVGALAIDNRRGGESFGASDYTLLDGLASQAVIAIENARLVEDLRRSREHVRRADRLGTLGTLAAGLAHEINNPLTSIRTFLALAPAKRSENDLEFWHDYHELACKEVDRIHGLVKTMGQLGRDVGDDAPRSACDLGALIEEAATLLGPEATRGHVAVEIAIESDLPKVFGVRDHLHQVVLNLLLNAIHATAKPGRAETGGGRVQVRARREAFDGEDGLAVDVVDDGVGIRSEDLERIFDPFFTTKGPDQGSGLGLMISHRIVSDHGGCIEVESLEGRGATFRVRLPVAPRAH
jgi:signal transduction histidine kinase/ActR/RegA family two-component response regulator